jgi:anti-sigma factor RsiW
MTHCPLTPKAQDWLDGELPTAEAATFEAHLGACAACAAEVEAYRAVFARLDGLPLLEPSPELHQRVLDAVLPHRAPRWVRVLGWSYAGVLAVSLGAMALALTQPGPSAWLRGLVATGIASAADSFAFALHASSRGLAAVVAMLASDGLAVRLLGIAWRLLSEPDVGLVLTAALLACAALMWWMRPREGRVNRGMPHVGLLGL